MYSVFKLRNMYNSLMKSISLWNFHFSTTFLTKRDAMGNIEFGGLRQRNCSTSNHIPPVQSFVIFYYLLISVHQVIT